MASGHKSADLRRQAGEKRLAQALKEAGFTRIRRAAQSGTNMILEARR